jgi:hypothetical protein
MRNRLDADYNHDDDTEDESESGTLADALRKTLREWWDPSVTAPQGVRAPVVSVEPEGNEWTLFVHPASGLTATDRAAIWRALDESAQEIVAETMPPGVQVRIIPPTQFPDGQMADGVIFFTYPGHRSTLAKNYWWQALAMECPAISARCSQKLNALTQANGGYLSPRQQVPKHIAQQLARRRAAAPPPASRRTPPRR